ncbi:FAD-binding protein [Niveispirillum sp.]|uniref:FAD-binding protein n=1 Tax=Niveispirillum sp. TaxID=1917217 RepID=UPI001B603F9D|nr:FAD-binding protein [Niveispirillum sp.]MBP7335649.1 FAD-binding protein [Niveispirillum sp.]
MTNQTWDESADFIIVGSGGGSMAAGLYLKSIGKQPLILEKTDKIGGSTAMSGGVLWIPNNPLQAREGIEDSEAAARTYLYRVVGNDAGPGSTPARKEAFLKAGPDMVRFLEGQGMKFIRAHGWSDYYDDLEGGCPESRSLAAPMLHARDMGPLFDKLRMGPMVMPLPVDQTRNITLATRTPRGMWEGVKLLWRLRQAYKTGKPMLSFGGSLQGRMLMLADAKGVPIRTRTGVTELVAQDGRIAGVVAQGPDGTTRRIQARDGVLINAGGFSHNPKMREQYGPKPASTQWTNANPGDTGEMIEIAQAHGAALDLMDQAWWVPGTLPPSGEVYMHVTDLSKPHVIVVGQNGRRIMNESQSYMANGHALYKAGVPAWVIMDSRHRQRYAWGTQPPGKTPADWETSGYMIKADSIRELAVKIGLNPDTLSQEVARFNGFAAAGKDLDFHRGERAYDNWFGDPWTKPNPNLGAIDKPPFLAFKMVPGDVGTAGGIVTDEHGRVLRSDGDAIPGLYATGNSTASVMGRVYPGAGASIAASFVFAWLAAKHACG